MKRNAIAIAKRIFLCVFLTFLLIAAAMLVFFSINEYRPDAIEPVEIAGSGTKELAVGDSLRIATLNTGYAALDETADFFMDGGSSIRPQSEEVIHANIAGISQFLIDYPCDAVFLQEVDRHSKRSFYIDQADAYAAQFGGLSTFATNFKALFVPFPLTSPDGMIGRVDAGLQTLSTFDSENAQRYSLPDSYSWPVRTCQLKRCLLRQEIPLSNSDKKLVLFNLHLEAYAPEAKKAAQTALLMELLAAEYEQGNYVIAGGDFNQTLPGADLSAYPLLNDSYFQAPLLNVDGLPEGFSFAFDDSVPTSRLLNEPYSHQPETTQLYVIDGFLLSPNVQVDSVETLDLDFRYTDHNPVLLEATLLP